MDQNTSLQQHKDVVQKNRTTHDWDPFQSAKDLVLGVSTEVNEVSNRI